MNTRRLLYGLLALTLLLGLASSPGLSQAATGHQANGPITQYGTGYRFEKNGWIYLHIEGEPYERGYQHGYLLAPELATILRSLKYLTYQETGKEWARYPIG